MTEQTKELLRQYADRYETKDFLQGDPSWFMHQVEGSANQEVMAFLASCLSYGSRPVFMKKIQILLDESHGAVDEWVASGEFQSFFTSEDSNCFYRFYSHGDMFRLLSTLRSVVREYGSLGEAVCNRVHDGLGAVEVICQLFNVNGRSRVIPVDTTSACKRVCMFLRWMVRKDSPVDLGLWSLGIDRRTLIMPLDTHVMQQSNRLGLINSNSTSMTTARRLTSILATVFPDDPLRGDFALFGYGVNGL